MIPPAISKLVAQAREPEASDIHICAGAPILFRVGKDLVPFSQGKVTPELSATMARKMLTEEQMAAFERDRDFDMMVADENGRYRVNMSFNDGAVGIVIRILPEAPWALADLHMPPVVGELCYRTKGLVLITGSTSQGKSSTMTGIISEINANLARHVVTIEDPIETVHPNRKSIVRQREVGRDTRDFYSGLRAALRQDPDVVAIGEMRDYETIRIALTAAETGILVLSTLHIISIDKMIERLLSYAPPEDQGHIRFLLAGALQGVIHQELLPATVGGKRVACEVLVANDAVKNVIRNRDSFMLRNILHTGRRQGMVTMRDSVNALLEEGAITEEVAQNVLANYQ